MNIKDFLRKRNDGQTEIVQELKQCATVVYVKVTEKSLTTSGSTGQVAYAVYQLVWSVGMRTGYGNLSVLEAWVRHHI